MNFKKNAKTKSVKSFKTDQLSRNGQKSVKGGCCDNPPPCPKLPC